MEQKAVDYSYRSIWLMAYPILISLIMEQMIGITDTAFLGRVGEVELGASAIAGVYYLAIFMIGFGFTVGSQILMARRNGEGNYKAIGGIFYQGIYFLLLMSAVIFTVSQVYSEEILGLLVTSDKIAGAASSYIHWRVYGFFFSFIGAMFRAFFVGTTQTRTLTLNSIVMVLANVIFNYTDLGNSDFPSSGYCRSSHRFLPCRTGICNLLRDLYLAPDRLPKIRAQPDSGFPYPFAYHRS